LLVERVEREGWTIAAAAAAIGCSQRTAAKWLSRWRRFGEDGLFDRSSAPHRVPSRTPQDRIEAIVALRRVAFTAPHIASILSMASSTVSGVLTSLGLGRLSQLEPREPANRYERRAAGDLLHIDIKKLGRIDGVGHRIFGSHTSRDRRGNWHGQRRILGWEYVHVCVDDATRLAYAEVLTDETGATVAGFLERAVAFYASYGIRVQRVMTDNGPGYRSIRHAIACRKLGLRHLRTRPYRPQTNGKAERFIRTLLGGWAYGAIYGTSRERTAALAGWLDFYNRHRPHGSLNHQPPLTRLRELNNPLGSYS
jgi:transposase InsO family protein